MTATKTSAELPAWLRDLNLARVVSGVPSEATAVCWDSRQCVEEAVFVAVPGMAVDGNSFIREAISRGARSIIVQEDLRERWGPQIVEDVTFVAVPDARAALAEAAAGFYGHPARSLGVIGVTGTDGKTTTTHLIGHVLNATGKRAGYLSSAEFAVGGAAELNKTHLTTVESPEVQRLLARIRDEGGQHAVLEASSHGLALHRLDQCEFDVGVFTNLAADHLDFHGTMAAYRDAKAILFRMLDESADKGFGKAAVLNADDPASAELARVTRQPVITYGLGGGANLTGHDITLDRLGTRFRARMFGEDVEVRTPLLGDYNVSNCLAAVAAAMSQGVEFAEAVRALATFPGVPGRMEIIEEGQKFRVVVDIASTEQAMRNVLSVLRPVTEGRLIVVFGAAGDRDPARRRGIARAVAALADEAVITNEDPRGEPPDVILDSIEEGFKASGFSSYEREMDRRLAIERAFQQARKGDTVLLAGKGTEPSIEMATEAIPWDEAQAARELLKELQA